jgi:hypothetical protein
MRRSITKHGTALMPSAAAVRSSSRTSAAKRSVASVSRTLLGVQPDVSGQALERGVVAHQLALGPRIRRSFIASRRRAPPRGARAAARRMVLRARAVSKWNSSPSAAAHVGHLRVHRLRMLDARAILRGEVLGAVALALRTRGSRASPHRDPAPHRRQSQPGDERASRNRADPRPLGTSRSRPGDR